MSPFIYSDIIYRAALQFAYEEASQENFEFFIKAAARHYNKGQRILGLNIAAVERW